MVAAGSSCGAVSLARFPFPRRGGFVRGGQHACGVAQLAWVAGDGALLSVGGADRTIMQWKVIFDDARESGNEGGKSCDDSGIEFDAGRIALV